MSGQKLKAQKAGKRLTYSNEWSGTQRYQRQRNPEFEARFVHTPAWTETVLDFDDETLKEGITLNEDGTIKNAKVILGRKDKIVLPHESKCVKDLPEDCMPLISYLHGIRDPKRELPDYAYVWVTPSRIRHAVRGDWLLYHINGLVDVFAYFDPAVWGFAAWLIDEKLLGNIVTPEEYATLERSLTDKETELKPFRERFLAAVVLVE